MIPHTTGSTSFSWSKIPHSRNYELRRNDVPVGTLRRPSIWSSNFVAQAQHGEWTFRRAGYCGTSAEILDSVSEKPIATLKCSWGGKRALTFADGQTFRLECKGWWRPEWTIVPDDGQVVARIQTRSKQVEITNSSGVPDDRLTLLIMFAWYQVLQVEEDASTAATVAVIAAT
jgi:hypothetical protein